MIWESEYWKKPLLRLAGKLNRWSTPRVWTEQELVSIEKDVFIAFYSIRKLIDAKKLSDSTEAMMISVNMFPGKGKNVTLLNWHKIDSLYDFSSSNDGNRDLRFISNQVIHSYVFLPDIKEDGSLGGILFCSDRERNKNLFRLDVAELIKILRIVGKDYPPRSTLVFNAKKQDYDQTNW